MKTTPIVISLIVPASVVCLLTFMQYFNNKESMKMTEGCYCVSLHKGYIFLAVAGLAMSVVIGVGIYLQIDTVTYNVWRNLCGYAGVAALSFIGMGALSHILFHKIKVDGNKITVFRPLRKTFSCSFYDIASVKRRAPNNGYNFEWITVKTYSGKKFMVDNNEIAYDRFVKSLCNKVTRSKLIGFEEDRNFKRHR